MKNIFKRFLCAAMVAVSAISMGSFADAVDVKAVMHSADRETVAKVKQNLEIGMKCRLEIASGEEGPVVIIPANITSIKLLATRVPVGTVAGAGDATQCNVEVAYNSSRFLVPDFMRAGPTVEEKNEWLHNVQVEQKMDKPRLGVAERRVPEDMKGISYRTIIVTLIVAGEKGEVRIPLKFSGNVEELDMPVRS